MDALGNVDTCFEQLLEKEQRWTTRSGPYSHVSLHVLMLTVLVRTLRARLYVSSLLELMGRRRYCRK